MHQTKGTKAQAFRLTRKPSATNKRASFPANIKEGTFKFKQEMQSFRLIKTHAFRPTLGSSITCVHAVCIPGLATVFSSDRSLRGPLQGQNRIVKEFPSSIQ